MTGIDDTIVVKIDGVWYLFTNKEEGLAAVNEEYKKKEREKRLKDWQINRLNYIRQRRKKYGK